MNTIYIWPTAMSPKGRRYILCAEADSAGEAVERVVLKLARTIPDTDELIQVEKMLHENPPMEMDFSERVGVLAFDAEPR